MKKLFVKFSLAFLALFAVVACVERLAAYAVTDHMYFGAEGGTQETRIGYHSKKNSGSDAWGLPVIRIYEERDGKMVMDTLRSYAKREELLPTGEYELDGGWVKCYYPKRRNKIRVEVAPNKTGKPRKAEFSAPSRETGVDISIFQSAE